MFYVLKKENSQVINNIIDTKNCVCFYHWVNCGHCHQMMPVWMKLCKDHGKDVNIINIELSNMQYLNPQSRNIMGFPTILSYQNGNKKEEFHGIRDHESLKTFILKSKIPLVKKAIKVAKPVSKKVKKPLKPKK
jgi:thiol-disulfide isomerase/thioredoxin